MEQQWWRGQLATQVHQALRRKEQELPMYTAGSPQLGMRRCFVSLVMALSNCCGLCLTAQHLAIRLLDLCMDSYNIDFQQLQVIAFLCLLLASKFEETPNKVPDLAYLNHLAHTFGMNVALNNEDLLSMEMQLLRAFNWNLCLPTAAHYIDYYLCVSVGENDFHHHWPLASLTEIKDFLRKYAYYFLHMSVQDHTFLRFAPSLIAAACVCTSRVCVRISPAWTADLELLTYYSSEQLAKCVDMMFTNYVNDAREARNIYQQVMLQHQEQEAVGSLSCGAAAPHGYVLAAEKGNVTSVRV